MKRIGPEVKKPDLKAPAFVGDVWWDLRERRLLPLVALILVAIVATPILLKDASEEPIAVPPAAGPNAMRGDTGDASLTVVQAKPGLRDYRKRLADRDPTDPFEQRYAAPQVDDAKLNPETGGSSGDEVQVGDDEGSSPGGAASPESSGGSGKKPTLTIFAPAIKVSITKAGGKNAKTSKKERYVRDRVLPRTPLPGKKAPVVTYMGTGEKGRRALLLVSTKVSSLFGDTRCTTNEDVCQLIEVEPGFPVTFVYGANEVRYTINVHKIELVVIGRA